jgi:hypothetical protein
VEEALRTPGALLFSFSSDPNAPGKPGSAHVAISQGNGRTIEAKGRLYGVGEWSAKRRFTYAGVIPGISDADSVKEFTRNASTRSPDSSDDGPGGDGDDQAPAGSNGAGTNGSGANGSGSNGAGTNGASRDPFGISTGTPLAAAPGTGPLDVDTDRDGLTDAFEKLAGTNAKKADTDRDGLSDSYEALSSHTDPLSRDTDRDRVTDAAEIAAGSDAGRLPGTAGVIGTGAFAENSRKPGKDRDRDGLSDRVEKLVGTNHRKADTDGDRLPDAMEAARGTNPTLADTDADGISDGLELQYHSNPLAAGSGLGGLGGPAGVGGLAGAAAAPGVDPAPPSGEGPLS